MQLLVTQKEIPSLVTHFARKDHAKAIEVLAHWTRDHYSANTQDVAASQQEMQESLKLAAAQLKLNVSPQVTPSLNGLLAQGFEGGRLVAIPAICGMVAPAVVALYDDKSAKAFQFEDGGLREATITNPGQKDVGIMLGGSSKASVDAKTLDLVVNDYSGGDCFRVTTENKPRRKTTFTSYTGPDVMKTIVIDGRLHDSYVVTGTERFEIRGQGEAGWETSFRD